MKPGPQPWNAGITPGLRPQDEPVRPDPEQVLAELTERVERLEAALSLREGTVGTTNWVNVEVESIVAATEKAIYVRTPDGEEVWLPRSQLSEGEKYQKGWTELTLSVTEFIAREKGLKGVG